MTKYRAYFFTNYYLSSIQHGIQVAHCLQEMNLNYGNKSEEYKILNNWARLHKTIVILNAGNNQQLKEISKEIADCGVKLYLPTAWFYEDKQSLNEMLTCAGIILPNNIYEANDNSYDIGYIDHNTGERIPLSENEFKLYRIIKSKKLAQ